MQFAWAAFFMLYITASMSQRISNSNIRYEL